MLSTGRSVDNTHLGDTKVYGSLEITEDLTVDGDITLGGGLTISPPDCLSVDCVKPATVSGDVSIKTSGDADIAILKDDKEVHVFNVIRPLTDDLSLTSFNNNGTLSISDGAGIPPPGVRVLNGDMYSDKYRSNSSTGLTDPEIDMADGALKIGFAGGNSNIITATNSDNSVQISNAYKLPTSAGTEGQIMTVNVGDTTTSFQDPVLPLTPSQEFGYIAIGNTSYNSSRTLIWSSLGGTNQFSTDVLSTGGYVEFKTIGKIYARRTQDGIVSATYNLEVDVAQTGGYNNTTTMTWSISDNVFVLDKDVDYERDYEFRFTIQRMGLNSFTVYGTGTCTQLVNPTGTVQLPAQMMQFQDVKDSDSNLLFTTNGTDVKINVYFTAAQDPGVITSLVPFSGQFHGHQLGFLPGPILNTSDHSQLTNLGLGDSHQQYSLLSGRSGGQAIIGGTVAADTLVLQSNAADPLDGHVEFKSFIDMQTHQILNVGTAGGIGQLVATNTSNGLDFIQALSTGITSGGVLSIGAGSDEFSITDGCGIILTSNPLVDASISHVDVSWTGKTNIQIANIGTHNITFIAIDSAGNVVQLLLKPTPEERRTTYIYLGIVVHIDLTTVSAVTNEQDFSQAPLSQVRDLSSALGYLNISGNIIAPSATDLKIQKSSGTIYATGSNYAIDPFDPNIKTLVALDPITFTYRLQSGVAILPSTTDIDPNNYDLGGVLTPLTNNYWSIQRVYVFTSNGIEIQPGQAEYKTQEDALAAIETEQFVTVPGIAANGLHIANLVVKDGASDLSTSDAIFIAIGKFGTTSSTTGISGDLFGPSPPVSDSNLCSFDTSSGKLIKDSQIPTISVANTLSTGLYTGGLLTAPTTTTFTITDGTGSLMTSDPHGTGTVSQESITWSGITGVAATGIAGGPQTYICIGTGGAVFQLASKPTLSQRRTTYILIGVLEHPNLSTITDVLEEQDYSAYPVSQLRDLAESIGKLNVSGNIISSPAGTLNIDKTIGEMFEMGSNYDTDPFSPNITSLAALTTATLQHVLSDGTLTGTDTVIDPNFYDDGTSTPVAVSNNYYTIQRIYILSDDSLFVQPGQAEYKTEVLARAGVQSEAFTVATQLVLEGLHLCNIIMKQGETDLDIAVFIQIGKFGQSSVSSSGDVYGPSVAVDGNLCSFDTTTGKLIKDSLIAASDVATVSYVSGGYLPLGGGNLTGNLSANGFDIKGEEVIGTLNVQVGVGNTNGSLFFSGSTNGGNIIYTPANQSDSLTIKPLGGDSMMVFNTTTGSEYVKLLKPLNMRTNVIYGGLDASNNLTLESTSNVSKGSIICNDDIVGQAATFTGDLLLDYALPALNTFNTGSNTGTSIRNTATDLLLSADGDSNQILISHTPDQGLSFTIEDVADAITFKGSEIKTTLPINMSSQKITSLLDPTLDQDGATKKYVDDLVADAYDSSVYTYTGAVLNGTPTNTFICQKRGEEVTISWNRKQLANSALTASPSALSISGIPVDFRPSAPRTALTHIVQNGVYSVGLVQIETSGSMAFYSGIAFTDLFLGTATGGTRVISSSSMTFMC